MGAIVTTTVDDGGTGGGEREATVRRPPAERLVSLLAPGSFEAEQYRALRHVLERRRRTERLAAVAVSSAAAGEGKTTTAINLAGALAQSPDARVLLVDADVRLPSVAQQLGLEESCPGLVDAVADPRLPLQDAVRRLPGSRLAVLPAGRLPESPYEVLKSPRLGEILARARRDYEWVIVDAPPLLPVPDGRILARWVDAVILVVAAHRTPRQLVAETLNLLEPGVVAGFVLNGDDRPYSGYYGSYYGYGHARRRSGAGRWGAAARAAGARR
jgi:receptor protein-tyrosine kinase